MIRVEKEKRKKRIFDFVNIREKEVKLAIIVTILIDIVLNKIEIYKNFYCYEEKISSLIEVIIGSDIGLLGFSVSGIAIIVTLFTKEETFLITKYNGEDSIDRILSEYGFITWSITINLLYLIIIDLCLSSTLEVFGKIIFGIVITIIVYHISFNIFYLVDVVENCIKLYKIKQTYGRIVDNNLKGEANEIRIDFIFAILMNLCESSQEQLCDELIKYVKKTATEEEAKKLINYFTERYK